MAASARLLTSTAVQEGRYLKQGDCKNTLYQPKLPDDELCIVKPHMRCPKSKMGTYWKFNKTLYGLARSAHHWYTKILEILKDMKFEAMGQDQCVFKCTPFSGKPPI